MFLFFGVSKAKANTVVQGIDLTDSEYQQFLSILLEGAKVLSEKDVNLMSRERASAGLYMTSHIQNKGWLPTKSLYDMRNPDGIWTGTVGQFLRMEAFVMKFENLGTSVSYNAHVQNISWQGWKNGGDIAGTTGKSLRIEALSIYTSGKLRVAFRGHIQNSGWTGFRNSMGIFGQEYVGTVGQSKRLEAIQCIVYSTGQM